MYSLVFNIFCLVNNFDYRFDINDIKHDPFVVSILCCYWKAVGRIVIVWSLCLKQSCYYVVFFLPAVVMKLLLWSGKLHLSNKRKRNPLELMVIIYLIDKYCLRIMHIIWHGNVMDKNIWLAKIILFHFCPVIKFLLTYSFWETIFILRFE